MSKTLSLEELLADLNPDDVIPPLRRIVNGWRTAEQDREYHIKARRAYRKFAQLVERAENILATLGTHGSPGSARTLHLRRLLFEAQVADARKQLASMCRCEDAIEVWWCGDTGHHILADAIAHYDYLGITTDDFKALVDGAS